MCPSVLRLFLISLETILYFCASILKDDVINLIVNIQRLRIRTAYQPTNRLLY